MKRLPTDIERTRYDVIVVGGGIYGICVLRDAALRGLKAILLERADFAHATSGNSHKIIHGGLRYLQHGDLKRMRESIRDRSALLRIAPHLVKPMPFVIPTYTDRGASRTLLRIACFLNDLVAYDRNAHLLASLSFPRSGALSRRECVGQFPFLDSPQLTGGVQYFDAQVRSPERLALSMLASASHEGAAMVNYAEVTSFIMHEGAVAGAYVRDTIRENTLEIRGKLVVNCCGPWVGNMCSWGHAAGVRSTPQPMMKAMVLVTNPLSRNAAFGVPSQYEYVDADAVMNKGSRYFFVTPWRDRSLVGTFQARYEGGPDEACVKEEEIEAQLQEVNAALPGASISRDDVHLVNWGLLPSAGGGTGRDVQLAKHPMICDHEVVDGVKGLMSVTGVKFTTARGVAQRVVDLVCRKLGKAVGACQTATTPVVGGDMTSLEDVVFDALRRRPSQMSSDAAEHIACTYGTRFGDVFAHTDEDAELGGAIAAESPVTCAQVVHGVRHEMAQTLSDIIFRRTDLGTAGYPGSHTLDVCAALMAKELDWDRTRVAREVSNTQAEFRRKGAQV